MIVHFTQNALANLDSIFEYHADYNNDYAYKFNNEIMSQIRDNLSQFSEMGSLYNLKKSIRRLVFERYNVYYLHKPDIVYVLFVIDAKMHLNTEIQEPDFKIPSLT